MNQRKQACIVAGMLLSSMLLAGCGGSSNEQEAKITGTVPTNTGSIQSQRETARGTGEATKAAISNPSSPAGGNSSRRSK